MASEKQIAANRANAKRSTGLKTPAGKTVSSRNAFRHGLSGPARFDPVTFAKVEAIARALAGEEADEDRLMSAADFAQLAASPPAYPLDADRTDGEDRFKRQQ